MNKSRIANLTSTIVLNKFTQCICIYLVKSWKCPIRSWRSKYGLCDLSFKRKKNYCKNEFWTVIWSLLKRVFKNEVIFWNKNSFWLTESPIMAKPVYNCWFHPFGGCFVLRNFRVGWETTMGWTNWDPTSAGTGGQCTGTFKECFGRGCWRF